MGNRWGNSGQQERQVTRCAFQVEAVGPPGRGGLGGIPLREKRKNSRGTEEGLRLRPPGPGLLHSSLCIPTSLPLTFPHPPPFSNPGNLSFTCHIGSGSILSFSPASSQPGQPPSTSRLPLHPPSLDCTPLSFPPRETCVLHHSSPLPDPMAQDSFF